MNLRQINLLWDEYKSKYNVESDAKITAVKFDTEKYVEGCFNLLELMNGEYILHLNPNMHLYSENYCKFILFHEFTHFYDYIHCPYSVEEREKLIMWMNAYSEFHACRVTLARFIEMIRLRTVDVDKIQIPGQYREISIRRLLMESIYRCRLCFDAFRVSNDLQDYANGLRSTMYLFGYLSLFEQDEELVEQTLLSLQLRKQNYAKLYEAMRDLHFDDVLVYYKAITDEATLIYLRTAFRRYYSCDIISDEEIEEITLENYHDYIRMVNERLRGLGYDVVDMDECEEDDFSEAAYRITKPLAADANGDFHWFDNSHLIIK